MRNPPPENRIAQHFPPLAEKIEEPNPGTADEGVSRIRLAGRRAHRNGIRADDNPFPKSDGRRTEWFLGWYDVRLARFYGRKEEAIVTD